MKAPLKPAHASVASAVGHAASSALPHCRSSSSSASGSRSKLVQALKRNNMEHSESAAAAPGPAAKVQRRTDDADGRKPAITVWCSPQVPTLSDSMPWLQEFSGFSTVSSLTEASHVVVHDAIWNEACAYSVVSIHCKLWGKTLLAESHLQNPRNERYRTYASNTERKGQRQERFTLFISSAARDKHHKIADELVNFATNSSVRPRHGTDRRLFRLTVQDGGVMDVLNRFKSCDSAAEATQLRWLVTKGERDECITALASAISRPPAKLQPFVLTFSHFVNSIGKLASAQ